MKQGSIKRFCNVHAKRFLYANKSIKIPLSTPMLFKDLRYEWHTDDIQVHTSDMWMAYKYIQVTYGWHTSTYEWHTDGIQVHMSDIRITYHYIQVTCHYTWENASDILITSSTYKWDMNGIRVHTDNIWAHSSDKRMTYEWHTNDIWVTYKFIQLTYELHTNGIQMTWEWHKEYLTV